MSSDREVDGSNPALSPPSVEKHIPTLQLANVQRTVYVVYGGIWFTCSAELRLRWVKYSRSPFLWTSTHRTFSSPVSVQGSGYCPMWL